MAEVYTDRGPQGTQHKNANWLLLAVIAAAIIIAIIVAVAR